MTDKINTQGLLKTLKNPNFKKQIICFNFNYKIQYLSTILSTFTSKKLRKRKNVKLIL